MEKSWQDVPSRSRFPEPFSLSQFSWPVVRPWWRLNWNASLHPNRGFWVLGQREGSEGKGCREVVNTKSHPHTPDSACAVAVEAALAAGLREPKLMHVHARARADSPAAGTSNLQLLSSTRGPDTVHFTSSNLSFHFGTVHNLTRLCRLTTLFLATTFYTPGPIRSLCTGGPA